MAYFSPIAVSRLEKSYNPSVHSVSQANLPEAGKAGGEYLTPHPIAKAKIGHQYS